MKQTVSWTALPRGLDQGRLALSVFVSPRLEVGDGDAERLDTFPDFVSWPLTLGTVTFEVQLAGQPALPATVTSVADASLWSALFAPGTFVRSHRLRDWDEKVVYSFPAANVLGYLRERYTALALKATDHIAVEELLDPNTGFGDVAPPRIGRETTTDRELFAAIDEGLREEDRETGKRRRALPPRAPLPAADFLQLARYHAPLPKVKRTRPPAQTELDFHQVLSALGEQAPLLRPLGVVIDLVVDLPLRRLDEADTTVRVVPSWRSAVNTNPDDPRSSDVTPWTRCRVGPATFAVRPADPAEHVDGYLPLDESRYYEVQQVDVDGAALRLRQLVDGVVRSMRGSSVAQPLTATVPTLRSAGLSLVRTGRAVQLVSRLDRVRELFGQGSDAALSAEDLTRGFRLDVFEPETRTWRSLHQREATYRVGTREHRVTAEGWTSTAASTRPDEGDSVYLHEALAQWAGWSLSVPRPANVLERDGTVATQDSVNPAHPDIPLTMEFAVPPGTLPRLRFGRAYRLRARTVDLAGDGPALDDENGVAHATQEVVYARHEPVASPALLYRSPRTEGESLTRVVLRSDYDQPAGGPAPTPEVADFSYAADVQRHIAAPRVGQILAEEHGMFDAPQLDPGTYDVIAARANADFDQVPGVVADPRNYDRSYYPGPAAGVAPLPVPYLPDPLATAAYFRGLPGGPDGFLEVPFTAESPWPHSWPIRLVLAEGDGRPQVTDGDDERVLAVSLPKAGRVQVRVSCGIPEEQLDAMGVWRWMSEEGATEEQRRTALTGGNWMLTPHRVVELVHAVRRPLLPAEFHEDFRLLREAGQTFVTLDGQLFFHRASTGRVDITATWTDDVDPGTGDGAPADPPGQTSGRQHLPIPLREGRPHYLLSLEDRQEFGDTRHREVTYTTTVTTAFAEDFATRRRVTLPTVLDPKGIVAGSDKVHSVVAPVGESAVRYEAGRDYVVTPETGQITRTENSRIGAADEVEVTYIVPPITRTGTKAVTRTVLSSARPAPPKVLYVVPTFGWDRTPARSTRSGGGLRVWLDRPWFSSGNGELLGVVLDNSGQPISTDDRMDKLVTRWGYDPAFAKTAPSAPVPKIAHFPLGIHTAGARLAEVDTTAAVVGHKVEFDEERGLWFSDIVIDTGSAYMPFVRLALARFQPNSLPRLHLSPVVLCDFAQLTPQRTLTATRANPGKVGISVSGTGGRSAQGYNAVFAHVEEHSGSDEVLGWRQVGSRKELARASTFGRPHWSGEVAVPANKPGQRRVVVEEYERHGDGGERIVYSDTVTV